MFGLAFAVITTTAIILASRMPTWASAHNHAYREGDGRPNGADAHAAGRNARSGNPTGADRRSATDAIDAG